jgi:2,3,4,5-tetrahydropyridine-2-carboxylate N-succinyltransferase
MILQQIIERLYETPPEAATREDTLRAVEQLKLLLNSGEVRAAEERAGMWHVNTWVKKGILLAFRLGVLTEFPGSEGFQFFDKDTLPVRHFTAADGVRVVPGGSVVRDGAYVGPGVVIMPPSYINIGAHVGEGTMIDSHALVGSCAQVGRRVHLSAAAQLGGVLEPIRSVPVVIEDDVFVGGNCGIYEGTIVRRGAVIGTGVILTGSTPLYDLIREQVYRKTQTEPLIVPERAVVVPGSRLIGKGFAEQHHLSLYTPVIVKYRDEKTDAATALEQSLR